jgi:hypothetical protein
VLYSLLAFQVGQRKGDMSKLLKWFAGTKLASKILGRLFRGTENM